ncbi:Peptidoglycan-associated protein [Nitrospira tepida]|uniref:Peptidoglycan-associated protein n=1 Tax=Nitrospira tepida TaxID=2973512 RepID=A0AA86N398_9BACT|nr:peptidoglycan-associated lipoprotein Pal [Nitrospira tepida]CAI4033899.1 Peptidoglycan-associated protein [Nitrospira tepida]
MYGLIATTACRVLLGFLILGIVTGCSGKKLSSGSGDQSFIAGPKPEAPAVQATPEPVPPPPPPMEEAKVEPPVAQPVPAPTPEPVQPAPAPAPEPPAAPEPPIVAQAPAALPVEPPPPPAPSPSLEDIYFDYDQSVLRADARTTLEENAKVLRANDGQKIVIEGHCDERGTLAYNLILGERRAQSVKRYLENLGVPGSQMQIISYGKERPFCTDHSEACWQSNRRAHFVAR